MDQIINKIIEAFKIEYGFAPAKKNMQVKQWDWALYYVIVGGLSYEYDGVLETISRDPSGDLRAATATEYKKFIEAVEKR